MTISMYQASVPLFIQGLKGLKGVLAKGAAFAEARKFDPANLLTARLAPDMFTLTRQVQIACDFAKGAAGRLAGAELPVFEDKEQSFADLESRVDKTVEYLQGLSPAAIDGSEDSIIELNRRGEIVSFRGIEYLLGQAVPNFYFHCTAAYAILRSNGVDVGKKDYIGPA
jgi:hypothetical protein